MTTLPHRHPLRFKRDRRRAGRLAGAIVAALVCAPLAMAEEPAVPPFLPPPLCVVVEPLPAGVVASCSGLLWPEDWSRRALLCVQTRAPAETTAQLEHNLAIVRADARMAADQADAAAKALTICEREIRRVVAPEPAPAWKSPILWAVVGVVVGASIVGSAWAATR